METQIDDRGSFEIDERHMEAHFVSKGIRWQDYREMPEHLKTELLELWYLQDYQTQKASKG